MTEGGFTERYSLRQELRDLLKSDDVRYQLLTGLIRTALGNPGAFDLKAFQVILDLLGDDPENETGWYETKMNLTESDFEEHLKKYSDEELR